MAEPEIGAELLNVRHIEVSLLREQRRYRRDRIPVALATSVWLTPLASIAADILCAGETIGWCCGFVRFDEVAQDLEIVRLWRAQPYAAG